MDVDPSESEATHILCLRVTDLQHDVIENVFGHNNWEFVEELPPNAAANAQDDVPDDGLIPNVPGGGYRIPQNEEEDECPYCLCKPCITSEDNRQMWWEDRRTDAHDRNSGLRKEKYRRFWTMLYHRHVWGDPRYIARKDHALQQDLHHRLYAWLVVSGIEEI